MNWQSAVDFSLAALNFGVMITSICSGGQLWWTNLASGVFCFCMGLVALDK